MYNKRKRKKLKTYYNKKKEYNYLKRCQNKGNKQRNLIQEDQEEIVGIDNREKLGQEKLDFMELSGQYPEKV